MIDLPPEQLAIVLHILKEHVPECEVRAFGSRVTGNAKPYSDLDIALLGSGRLPFDLIAALREALEESDLSIRVDVLDWHTISESFRNIISAKYETLLNPTLPFDVSAKLEE